MSSGTGDPRLAELLELLKQRSGRSYTALAHRTGLSRSTLHRYCLGTTVPRTFGAVEQVARVCGADREELDALYRAWCQATAEAHAEGAGEAGNAGEAQHAGEAESGEDGAGAADAEDGNGRSPEGRSPDGRAPMDAGPASRAAPGGPAPAPGPSPDPEPPRAHHWLRAAALLLAFVLPSAVLLARNGTDGTGGGGDVHASTPAQARTGADGKSGDGGGEEEQDVRGPAWSIAPQRVPASFYGVNLGSDTGEMPGFHAGSVRLWHSGTRWSQIEPRRGTYRWRTLDRLTEAAERKGLPVLFTFGGTPHWAAPEGGRSVFADSRASPPDDLAEWDRFVGALASRYRGRIEAYELWDYPSDPGSYRGSLATLAEMVERAARIIREADPDARLACPSFGSLWEKEGRERLRKFIRTGAYEHCDVAALKLPPRRADGPPEEMVTLVKRVQRLFYSEGRGRTELWNTGPDRDVALRDQLGAREARDYAVRFYLSALYAKDQGVSRTYFYSWGSREVPIVVELAGGPPSEAGRRIGRLRGWLEGAAITSCGSGSRSGLAEGAYTCRFERGDSRLVVYWTTRGEAHVRLGEGARRLRTMDGTDTAVRPGERLVFGEEPVLVELRPRKG